MSSSKHSQSPQDTVTIIHEQFAKIKTLTSELHVQEQTVVILQEKLQETEYKLDELQRQYLQQDRQIQILQEEYKVLTENSNKKIKSLQQFNSQLLVSLKEVQDKNQFLVDQLKEQDEELQLQQNGKVDIEQHLHQLKSCIDELEKDLENSQIKNKNLKKENQILQEQFQNLSKEQTVIKKKDQDIAQLQQTYQNKIDQITEELQETKQLCTTLQMESNNLIREKKNFEEMQAKYENINLSFSQSLANNKKNEENLNQKVQDLREQIQEFDQNLRKLEGEKKILQTNNHALQHQMEEKESKFNDFIKSVSKKIQKFNKKNKTNESNGTPKQSVYERLYEKTGPRTSSTNRRSNNSKKSPRDLSNCTQVLQNLDDLLGSLDRQMNENLERGSSLIQQIQELKRYADDSQITKEQFRTQVEELKSINIKNKQEKEQLKTEVDDLGTINQRLKQEKDQLRVQLEQLSIRQKQENDILKQQIDELQILNQRVKQDEESKTIIIVNQLKQQVQDSWNLYNTENDRNKRIQEEKKALEIKLYQKDEQIIKVNEEYEKLGQNNLLLNQELCELKDVFRQVHLKIDELLLKKSLDQNKLCLMYGFVNQIFDLLKKLANDSLSRGQLCNYVYYYATISSSVRRQLISSSKLKRDRIYARFRRFKNSLKFIRILIQQTKFNHRKHKNPIINRIFQLVQDSQVSFNQNDKLDYIIESAIPLFQEQQERKDQQIDNHLAKELFINLLSSLYIADSQRQNFNNNSHKIAMKSEVDKENILKAFNQSKYFEDQLNLLQIRLKQFDEFVLNLQEEMQEKTIQVEKEKFHQLEKEKLLLEIDQLKSKQQKNIFSQNSSILEEHQQSTYSPQKGIALELMQRSKIPIIQLDTSSNSKILQQELSDILLRRNLNSFQVRTESSSGRKNAGKIIKQPYQ